MRFTAKTEYAVRAIIEISLVGDDKPAQVREIASKQAIPERFLEQVMAALKKASLIESIRGAQGGYRLTRPASEITMAQIIEAIEGPMQVMECLSKDNEHQKCHQAGLCAVKDVWASVQSSIVEALDSISLAKLTDNYKTKQKDSVGSAGPG